ncbi:hypothetical protein [Dactylosporangium sp. NPDC005555]
MESQLIEVVENSVLEPPMTADDAYGAVPEAEPEGADFSQTRKCGHWRS